MLHARDKLGELRRRLQWEPADVAHPTRLMARLGAYLYLAGASIVAVSTLLPIEDPVWRNETALLLVSLVGLYLALLILVIFDHMPMWGFNLFGVLGSGLVSLCVYYGGSDYRPIYFWIVLYAAYFFTGPQLALQVGAIAVFYSWALWARESFADTTLPWLLSVASIAVMGALVFALKNRLHELVARERRHVDQLVELDRTKDEVIAVVSHELRTPLASVYGAAVTLRRHELSPERKDELIEVISREAERLADLIDNILWTSRIDAGEVELDIKPVNLVAAATEAVEAARAIPAASLTVDLLVLNAVPPVAADRAKLVQVLESLLENAVKYSPEGGRVTLELERRGDGVQVTTRDQGMGIPEGQQSLIFEKFHRVDPQMRHGIGGSGLGLYIARDLVERMGGRLLVESVEGQGSTFSFTLPLA